MIEWEKRSDGTERYITDLTKAWDGINVVAEFVPNDDDDREGKLIMTLRDDRVGDFNLESNKKDKKGEVLATFEGLVEWTGETDDGLLKMAVKTVKHKGSHVVKYDPTQRRLLNRYDNFMTDLRRLSAWFLTERGAGFVNVDNAVNMYYDDVAMSKVEEMIGESKLAMFYETGLGVLRENMFVEIDLSLSWHERGRGNLTTRIFSERGDEGYLEAMVSKLGNEPLFMNITRCDKTQKSSKKKDSTIPEDAASLEKNMKKALLFLTVRYLRQVYSNVNVFKGIDKGSPVTLKWEEIEGMTDLWLGL